MFTKTSVVQKWMLLILHWFWSISNCAFHQESFTVCILLCILHEYIIRVFIQQLLEIVTSFKLMLTRFSSNQLHKLICSLLIQLSGRTSVSGQRSFAVLRSTCSWRVTTYVGKSSSLGQSTRPTQPFILSGSTNELQLDVRHHMRHLVNAYEGKAGMV